MRITNSSGSHETRYKKTSTTEKRVLASHLRWLASLLLALIALGRSDLQAVTGTTKWAVIKCKFSDQAAEPAFDPAYIIGPSGMAGYWFEVSGGQINLSGSAVYPTNGGWYTLSITLAQARNMTRSQRIAACVSAAGSDLNVSNFYSVIAIVNVAIDSGSDNARVLLDPLAWNITFAAHEMGHVYLPGDTTDHSFDDTNNVYCPGYQPGEYGNGWDIMSALNFGNSNPIFQGAYGVSGPGLNAPNMEKLGWLPAPLVTTWSGASQTVVLTPLNRRSPSGILMAKVPFDAGNSNHYYTVEFRRMAGWDRGISQDTVLVHEVQPDTRNYLVRRSGGPERLAGQRFLDVANNVAINVLNIDSATETATINIGRDQVWVDFAWPGLPFFPELGTFEFPYNTVSEGVFFVAYGGVINFKTGVSAEKPTVSTAMTLKAYNGPVTIGQ